LRRTDSPMAVKEELSNCRSARGRMNRVQVISIDMRIISAVKRVKAISDTMSHIILRGRWFHIIVLNVHALTNKLRGL
jgi:hypothetical protein